MDSILQHTLSRFLDVEQIDARRIFHGRGGMYPGLEQLSIDWYGPTILVSAYQALDFAPLLVEAIKAADRLHQVDNILLQKRYETAVPCEVLMGDTVATAIVSEAGLKFEVHPGVKQNAGLFLDTALLRRWLRTHCKDRTVLNLFAYTCSFSVAALSAGAHQVCNVDMSKSSIAWGQRNHLMNGLDPRQAVFIPHNLFRSWGRIRQFGRYHTVIIDPPTRQRGSFDVEKNYGAVLKKLPGLCHPGADIIATLNSPFLGADYLVDLFRHHVPTGSFVEMLPVAPEFVDRHPDRGLKICRFTMPG
ncbi:MAG: class I SAM-dependent methyltransferase [Gammaproteobacteria bacterium]